jgi:hypothetical protein
MTISQRNGTSSVTPTDGSYTLDRWRCNLSQTSKFTVQQDAGAVTPPAGFNDYLGVTSSSAYSITSTDIFQVTQVVEGFNMADLNWGSVNAKTVTLSFWVRSSLTGTFGGAIQNGGQNRSYPFSYTILSANTWEQKTVTIAGDTTGTWLTTTGRGAWITFSLGTGSTYSGTAGAWVAGDVESATGATSVVGTSGATWYVTGCQLEVGTQATSFEYRQYQQELALCQRYFQKYANASAGASAVFTIAQAYLTTAVIGAFVPPVAFRATPTINGVGYKTWTASAGDGGGTALSLAASSNTNFLRVEVTGASGLVAGNASGIQLSAGTTNYIDFSAEL